MNAVITALAMGMGQLTDKAVVKLLVKTAALTMLVFLVFGAALYFALAWAITAMGWELSGWVGAAAIVVVGVLAFWFLFRVVALAVLQFFADEIVIAVEERHYPQAAARARKLPFRQDLTNSLRGLGRAILFNALALPFAIVLLFTAIGPAVVFLIVNAVLLGRELTNMAWFRHTADPGSPNPVPSLERFILGAVIAAVMAVPFVNFIAPILGAAAGTHLAHRHMGAEHEI